MAGIRLSVNQSKAKNVSSIRNARGLEVKDVR